MAYFIKVDGEDAGLLGDFDEAPDTTWMPCDGRALSRSDYDPLFAELRTVYGTGDGTTTFNLPNLLGCSGR